MKRLFAVGALLSLATVGCGPKQQEITINGATVAIPAPVPSDKVANPVEILKAAGAIPGEGAAKGDYAAEGYWAANGKFPSSPENESVGAATQISVKSFPGREAMEKVISTDGGAMGSDSSKVLVGKTTPFYAIITGMMGSGGVVFDIDINQVAARIDAEIRP
jgi:hypothetical protein